MAKISVPNKQKKDSKNEEQYAGVASLAHWSFLMGFVVPFASLILPLVLYNTTGKENEFVKENAKRYYICRAGWMMGGGAKKDKKFINKIFKFSSIVSIFISLSIASVSEGL